MMKSDRPTCHTCVFWRPRTPHAGTCHAEPPRLGDLDEHGDAWGIWPLTPKHEMCGAHQDLRLWIEQNRDPAPPA